MVWIIIELLFPIVLIVLPGMLYNCHRPFIRKFYLRMVASRNARKLYVQCLLIFLLLYHYIYAGGHFGEWGIMLSTILCAVLFSFERADKWLHNLQEDKECFAPTALLALAAYAVPHLHTLAVTLAFILLAAMFYPSLYVLFRWQTEETRKSIIEDMDTLVQCYH